MSYIDEYAVGLSDLTAQAFEDEICTRLEHVLIGFQRVPAKPQGDGGLDGFSDSGTCGFCCYGPIPNAFKKTKDLEKDIVAKFSDDLLRLLELERAKGKKLLHKANLVLPSVLPVGAKLKQIILVVNWFESHNVIGPLHSALQEFKPLSQCNFVDSCAQLRIIGPKEFAQHYHADEVALLQLKSRTVLNKVHSLAAALTITDPGEFEEKIEILRRIRPDKLAAIDILVEQLRICWRANLAFEQELDSTIPTLHHALEEDRRRILMMVSYKSMQSNQIWNELLEIAKEAEELLKSDFNQYGSFLKDLSMGEVARLIGECPIGWEKAK